MIPREQPERTWIHDYIFIKSGYSKNDIEEMSIREYDFMLQVLLEINNKKAKSGEFQGI
jgi:hypothetical protein